ncbi:MAG: pitrilysin family protein [Pseudomonadota bacterium]
MEPKLSVLENGLRVVSQNVPEMPSVSVGVWAGAGSRAETASENGIAHLLEHMAFKGTKKRNAREIAEAIENVGGDINASTTVEQTSYYARVLKEDLALASDILGDILTNSVFAEDELAREKNVIAQEILSIQDNPDDLIFDLLSEAAYPDQPIGRPIAGTVESVKALTRSHITNFLDKNYHAPRCIVSAAGAVDHDQLCEQAQKYFLSLPKGEGTLPQAAQFAGREKREIRATQQVQIAFAYPGAAYGHDDIYKAHIFSGILGGGMSSRLFQEVREIRGLCYSISAFNWPFMESGLFALHAATGPELVMELVPTMMDVLQKSVKTVTADEVARSKAQLKAGILMALENTPSRAEHLARSLLIHDRIMPLDELVQKIDAVTVDDISAFGASMLSAPKCAFAAISPDKILPTTEQLRNWGYAV